MNEAEFAAQVAKELTIAMINKIGIHPTDQSTNEAMNRSYADQVATQYQVICRAVRAELSS